MPPNTPDVEANPWSQGVASKWAAPGSPKSPPRPPRDAPRPLKNPQWLPRVRMLVTDVAILVKLAAMAGEDTAGDCCGNAGETNDENDCM